MKSIGSESRMHQLWDLTGRDAVCAEDDITRTCRNQTSADEQKCMPPFGLIDNNMQYVAIALAHGK